MPALRAMGFVDGFNLYHAIDDLGEPHLKWVDVRLLVRQFVPASHFVLSRVVYCSAFATWRPKATERHLAYVRALESAGVHTVLGRFKARRRACYRCGSRWIQHEEKESDVNLALELMESAVDDAFDLAVLVTADSDLAPAVRRALRRGPGKRVRILTPPGRAKSSELTMAAGGRRSARKITRAHLERALLPAAGTTPDGRRWYRPPAYDPPTHGF